MQERGLWHDKDPSPERQGKKWRLDCGADIPTLTCCARHCLASQEDFRYQRSGHHETLLNHRLMFDLYSKFHCECNWIERYWADVKREVRANCDYTFLWPWIMHRHLPEHPRRFARTSRDTLLLTARGWMMHHGRQMMIAAVVQYIQQVLLNEAALRLFRNDSLQCQRFGTQRTLEQAYSLMEDSEEFGSQLVAEYEYDSDTSSE